jgi:hypothetical protein
MKARGLLVAALFLVMALAGCSGGEREEERHPAMEGMEDGWEIQITLLNGDVVTRHVFPSQEGHDFDKDGLDDLQEYIQGTDPNDADTSGDGLLDGNNVVLSPEDSLSAQWIERGIVYKELDDGRLEFQGSGDWQVDPSMQDTAGNGIMDGEEVGGFEVWILGERRFVTTIPHEYDSSGDNMGDGFKRDSGLDPTVQDTDGDGVPDIRDVNPWIDFQFRLEVVSLNLTSDPKGRNNPPMWFQVQSRDLSWQGPPVNVRVGETTDGAPLSSSTLVPSDEGGDFLRGQFNTSFAVTAVSADNQGEMVMDLFSSTTGSTSLIGAIHALTGELSMGHSDRDSWPDAARFEGEHGDVTLRLVPVWPDAWQRCIDEGCRHGDGEFPWR